MPRDPQGAETRSPKLRKPLHELSMSRLKQLQCGLCDQRLDRMKRDAGYCSSIWDTDKCTWHTRLNNAPMPPHAGEETKG